MKAYRIRGRFKMGRVWQPYAKEFAAEDEAAAREQLLSVFGSQHGTSRKNIRITDVVEIPPAEVEDHAVRYALEGRA